MEPVNIWKKILLQWIKKCNFLEKTFYSLDQTEIEVFFTHFKDRFKDENIYGYTNLSDFLKVEYPFFEPHFDDENTLSSSDHIYVYSLLLHYSCVKVPHQFFQENCKTLNEFAQRNITSFFEKLITEDPLTKETLRHVIASIHIFTPPSNRLMAYPVESPMKTPQKATTDISPPTPRSCMLQEKNQKVYSLNAQLETLNYEKSVLETDLKNYQEKIDKLNQQLKKSNQEIQDLKNELLSKCKENGDYCEVRHSEGEQIRKLNKKIAQKEEEMSKQRDTIEELAEQKRILCEKLKNAEKQMKLLQSNITDLAEKVDDLSQELEQKERTIQNLSDTNNELENYISEIRSSTVNSRPDLNASSEFLDLSRATNSSGSIHSPENLGSVVDIKLREKESENEKLREEISSIRIDNSKLSKAISELTTRYLKLFDVCSENLIIDDDADENEQNTIDPGNYFIIFSNYMQGFASKYEENCFELKKVKENERMIEEQNTNLTHRLEESVKQNAELKNEVEELLSTNKSLQTSKSSLENAVESLKNKLENCQREQAEGAINFENLQKEFKSIKLEKENIETQVEYLKTCLETKEDILTKLQSDNDQKDETINENIQKFKELDKENRSLNEKILEYEDIEKNLLDQLNHEKTERTQCDKQVDQLSIELEESKQNAEVLSNDKNYLLKLNEGNQKQMELMKHKIQTLTDDHDLKASIISELNSDKESLIDSMQFKIKDLLLVVDKYEEGFEQNAQKVKELTVKFENELISKQNELERLTLQKEDFEKITKHIFEQVKDHKSRLGIEPAETKFSLLSLNIDEDIQHLDGKIKEQTKSCLSDLSSTCSHVLNEKSEMKVTIENLTKSNVSLENDVAHLQDKYLKETSNNEKLIQKEADLQKQISLMTLSAENLERNIQSKTEEIDTLSKTHEQNRLTLQSLEEKITQLEYDVKSTNVTNQNLNEELQNTKTQLDSEVAEKQKIKQDLQLSIEMRDQLQSTITLLETKMTEMKEESNKTSNELLEKMKKELESVENVLKETRLSFENEAKEKKEMKERLEIEKQQIQEELKREIRRVNDESQCTVMKLNEELENTKLKLETEVSEKQKLFKVCENSKTEFENLKLKFKNAAEEIENLNKEFESKKLEMESEVTEKIKLIEELEKARLQFENEAEEKKKIKECLEKTKLQFENEFEEKKKIKEDLENEIQDIKKELVIVRSQSEATVNDLHQQLENIKLKIESEISEKQILNEDFERTKSGFETEMEKLNKELEINKLQIENEITEKLRFKEELEKTKLEFEDERRRIDLQSETLSSQLKELHFEMDRQRLQFENQVQEKQQIIEELQLQLKNEQANKQQLQAYIEKISKEKQDQVSTLAKELKNANEMKNHLESEVETIKQGLEKVCVELETKVAENLKFKHDFESTKLRLENEITEKCKISETLTESQKKTTEASKAMEDLLKANKTLNAEKTELQAKYEVQIQLHQDTKLQLQNELSAQKKLAEKFETAIQELTKTIQELEIKNEAINKTSDAFDKQLESMRVMLANEITEKCNLDRKYQASIAEMEKLQNDQTRLLGDVEILKNTHQNHLQKCNKEIDEQKENVSRLIQEIASLRKEKEFAEEEKRILSKRLESKLNEQQSKETTQRSIEEKLQQSEKEVLVKLNLLKTEQLKTQDLENQLKKLQMETSKLRESAETNMKRIEKQALALGESQAKCQKLKKEADAAQNTLESVKSSTESTQRENARLNQDCKCLREKLSKCEKLKDQLEARIQSQQKEIEALIAENKTLETSESDWKTSKSSLEKVKLVLEEKIRKLSKSLSDENVALNKLEQENVRLNLEVGGLNKQLEEYKSLLNMKLSEIESLTSDLTEAKNTNSKLIELNEKHQIKADEIHEENVRLNDQLSKISLRLQISQKEHDNVKSELQHLRSDVQAANVEKEAIEKDHRTAIERLMGIEERRAVEVEFDNKIKSLESQITKLTIEKCDLEELRSQDHINIEQLKTDIKIFEAKLQKSRNICEENEKKWAEEKESLLADARGSEERIKETRLELEGKLEKMKNKMKTLYNDEVAKMKKKQEREVAVYVTEIDSLKIKNEKHEEHIKKLSSQIFRLNENLLEYQKENTFLKTKLKDLENKPRQLTRVRPVSCTAASSVLSSNLRMEDEEGEIFNNTYLSDLKDGRMSEYFNTDICAQELQYRNSLLPPHLKSTYLAQFDHQLGEDEIRDTPNLDDSSSTLLNTGQRKKVSGATSYKRPGPPTPSKNAGRLSFGGIGELNREILKESIDTASCSSSSSKTPAKFKFFSSKLVMRGEERKSYVTNFKRKLLVGSGGSVQCSSTPRKSKAHIDQRRLLDQIMSTASPGSGPEFSPNCIVKPATNLPSSLKNLESTRRLSSLYKWRQPKLSYASDSGNSDVNSPRLKSIRYSEFAAGRSSSGSKKRNKRAKDRRASIYFRGTMFARNCRTPSVGTREVHKNKAKLQRIANFNRYRHEALNEMLVKKASFDPSWDDDESCNSCNNNNDEFFLQDMNIKKQDFNETDCSNNDKTSKHFQQLLDAKESHAPFEISAINSNPSNSNVNNSSSNVHSRTIYGASVILNRKIPHINTTMVRKSSIYVKGNDGKSVILVTNQTITLKDLAHIWIQMNVTAKSLIAFSFTATLIGLLSIVIQFIRQ